MKIEFVNEPYYVSEACDCCEGWWYDKWLVKVDGIFLGDYLDGEFVRHSFDEIDYAKAWMFDRIAKNMNFGVTVINPDTNDE